MEKLKTINKIILGVALALLLYSFWHKNDLPPSLEMTNALAIDPVQEAVEMPPFTVDKDGYEALITPLYKYEIRGLVVADYDSENWLDYAHKSDPFNTRDLCLLWGANLNNDLHRRIEFKHGEFTCYWRADNWTDYGLFKNEQISNNHLIPATDEIYRRIKQAAIGDQVMISGYLADYSIKGPSGFSSVRQSSVVRSDTGNGACEVIYAAGFSIIKSGQPVFRTIFDISRTVVLVCLLAAVVLFFIELKFGIGKNNPPDRLA